MYNVYATYITAFRLLECKAIFSRGARTRQRPFSENVHLPKVGTVKSVSKSVPQHYSAAALFSKDRQLNRFGQLLPRNDATRRPAPIPYKLITPNQTRLRKVVSLHCGGARPPPYFIAALCRPIGTAHRLGFSIVIVLTYSFVLSFQPARLKTSSQCQKRLELGGPACRSIIYAKRVDFQGGKMYTSAKNSSDCSVFMADERRIYTNHSEKSGETLLRHHPHPQFDELTVL